MAAPAVFSGDEKISAGGSLTAQTQPRIVRVISQPVEIVPEGVLFLLKNKDRPGIVGYLGTLMATPQCQHRQHELEPRYRRRPGARRPESRQRAPAGEIDEIQKDRTSATCASQNFSVRFPVFMNNLIFSPARRVTMAAGILMALAMAPACPVANAVSANPPAKDADLFPDPCRGHWQRI